MNAYRDNANHLSCLNDLDEEKERSANLRDVLAESQRELLDERRNHRKTYWFFWAATVVVGTLSSATVAWVERFDPKVEPAVVVPVECHDEALVFPRMTNQYTVKCSNPQAKMEPTLTDDAIFWQCACPHKP
jgi:hypothetical protein